MTNQQPVTVIGGGLAGCEAAWQLAQRGIPVRLYEMRPGCATPAHRTDRLAELVCSNSLKSEAPDSAPFLLKQELRAMHSLLLRVADSCRVPAGQALAVDRSLFSAQVTREIEGHPAMTVIREELHRIPAEGLVLVASGPLTSEAMSRAIARLTGAEHLYFYDAISPIVDASTLDMNRVYAASRYGKGGAEDYLNCPMSEEEYDRFFQALLDATTVPFKDFEKKAFFEACLPLEELARRGRNTLLFGPMKPVGLNDPRTGRRPWAVLQLRKENLMSDSYNLVGCQNHMKFDDQREVFRLIPGLESAEFLRFGQVHRNTYINAPRALLPTLQSRCDGRIFFAGQISGVEGYIESIATGLIAGVNAARLIRGSEPLVLPEETACGSLVRYIAKADPEGFQPMNTTFGLLPPLPEADRRRLKDKRKRHQYQVEAALAVHREFLTRNAETFR